MYTVLKDICYTGIPRTKRLDTRYLTQQFFPASNMTMVLYEAIGMKRFIQLTSKKFNDEKMENEHQIVHNVLGGVEMESYHVKP